MTTRAAVAARLPRVRGLPLIEAAAYVGVSAGHFTRLVQQQLMPRPRLLLGVPRYDVDELDAAFKALPREGGEAALEEVDTWADA
jgi:hypothetical protein